MTVTTNDRGQQNLFAKEPRMYVSQIDAERYGYETYADYWYKRDCQWFILSEEGLKLQSKTWEDLKLGLDREPGTVVNLKDFKNISKPGKDNDSET